MNSKVNFFKKRPTPPLGERALEALQAENSLKRSQTTALQQKEKSVIKQKQYQYQCGKRSGPRPAAAQPHLD